MLISQHLFLLILIKLSDVVKNDVVKKDLYNVKIKSIEDKIHDITNLATNTTLNAKINEAKKEIPTITNLAETNSLMLKPKYLLLVIQSKNN